MNCTCESRELLRNGCTCGYLNQNKVTKRIANFAMDIVIDNFIKESEVVKSATDKGFPFQPGDLLTGMDRSFPRSIYQLKHFGLFTVIIEQVSFCGEVISEAHSEAAAQCGPRGNWLQRRIRMNKFIKEFRLATPEEVTKSATDSSDHPNPYRKTP